MADDLDLEILLHHAEGEGPSPEFVALLRQRVIEETSSGARPVAGPPGATVVELDRPEPSGPPTFRRRLVALAAALVVIAGAVVIATSRSEVPTVTDGLPADAQLLTDENSLLEPGTYLIDTVGTPFSLTLDEQQFVAGNGRGRIVIADSGSQDLGDRTIVFTRLSALTDPFRPTGPTASLEPDWRAHDFAGWLDNAPAEIRISNRQQTRLGGLPATRADLELGATACRPELDYCVLFGTNRSLHDIELRAGASYRIWIVEQAREDPLAVVVAIDRDGDRAWFEAAESILDTLTFGEVGANPILATSGGATDLPSREEYELNWRRTPSPSRTPGDSVGSNSRGGELTPSSCPIPPISTGTGSKRATSSSRLSVRSVSRSPDSRCRRSMGSPPGSSISAPSRSIQRCDSPRQASESGRFRAAVACGWSSIPIADCW